MAVWQQFGLLLWKNYIHQKRQILVTVIEIALPLLFSVILIVLRQKVSFTIYPNATHYQSFQVNVPPGQVCFKDLAYVPGNASVVRQIAEDVKESMKWCISSVRGFETEEEFETFVKTDPHSSDVLAAVVFEHKFTHDDEPLPLQPSYWCSSPRVALQHAGIMLELFLFFTSLL